jgi:hypothetical protein
MTTPQGPETPIRVAITDNFQFDGISVRMGVRHGPGHYSVIHFGDHGYAVMEQIDQYGVEVEPSFTITNEFGRALLDALLRYYQGASDMHTLRADYLHERERVDKMMLTLSVIATKER